MNYMGNQRINNTDNVGAYQPASNRMSAEQRMFVKNHPNSNKNMNVYRTNCNGNDISESYNMSPVSSTVNNGMSVINPPSNNQQIISLRPETMTNTDFLPAYLNQYLGNWVRAEFFIGDTIEQRVGVLHEVGASYIIIEAIEPQTLIVCDIFSLRFAYKLYFFNCFPI